MITHGAEHIVNSQDDLMVNDDIDTIIKRGEERTQELNSKYEDLSFDALSNFKSEASVQQWEGEDFRPGVGVHRVRRLAFAHPIMCIRGKPCSSTRSRCPSASAS